MWESALTAVLDQVTPLVLTYNEEPNIARCLAHLRWAKRIVVVDSGSTDGTLEILHQDVRVRVIHNAWPGFAEQRNHGMQFIDTPWVLSLDADYVISPAMVESLVAALQTDGYSAWEAAFSYWIWGAPIRGAILPPREILFNKSSCHYVPDGHSEKLVVDGQVGRLDSRLWHDDRKSLKRWIGSQITYSEQESRKLLLAKKSDLSWPDKIRSVTLLGPILVPALSLTRGGILSGWRGIYYAVQRGLAELMLVLCLLDLRLRNRSQDQEHS